MNYKNNNESDITIKHIYVSISNLKSVFINQNHSSIDFNYHVHSTTRVHALSCGLFQASALSAAEPFLHLLTATDLPVYHTLTTSFIPTCHSYPLIIH